MFFDGQQKIKEPNSGFCIGQKFSRRAFPLVMPAADIKPRVVDLTRFISVSTNVGITPPHIDLEVVDLTDDSMPNSTCSVIVCPSFLQRTTLEVSTATASTATASTAKPVDKQMITPWQPLRPPRRWLQEGSDGRLQLPEQWQVCIHRLMDGAYR